jgi:hypothetical protein
VRDTLIYFAAKAVSYPKLGLVEPDTQSAFLQFIREWADNLIFILTGM